MAWMLGFFMPTDYGKRFLFLYTRQIGKIEMGRLGGWE
jgi:hypothetical protein